MRSQLGACGGLGGGEEAAKNGRDAEGLKESTRDAAYAESDCAGGTAPEIGVVPQTSKERKTELARFQSR